MTTVSPSEYSLFFIIYISSATHLFTKPELLELLTKCRDNNTKLGLTGMLLYKDGSFMQVLEGDEATVRALYAKVEADPRHRGVIVLLQGRTDERQFPDWSMGFRDLNSPEVVTTSGYHEFLNTPLTDQQFFADPTRCQKLLLAFKKNM